MTNRGVDEPACRNEIICSAVQLFFWPCRVDVHRDVDYEPACFGSTVASMDTSTVQYTTMIVLILIVASHFASLDRSDGLSSYFLYNYYS